MDNMVKERNLGCSVLFQGQDAVERPQDSSVVEIKDDAIDVSTETKARLGLLLNALLISILANSLRSHTCACYDR